MLIMASFLIVYIGLAELLKIDLLALRLPDWNPVAHRLGEFAILWTVSCLGYGWYIVLVRRDSPKRINLSVPALVPALVGVIVTVYKAWWVYGKHVQSPSDAGLVFFVAPVVSSLWPTFMGALGALVLLIHGKCWRRWQA